MQSGGDSPLKNLWDEICVQVQDEESFYWVFHIELINDVLFNEIKKEGNSIKSATWLQTKEGDRKSVV